MAKDKGGSKPQAEASAKSGNGGGSGGTTALKKITVPAVLGEKAAKLAPKKGEAAVPLFRVFGIANGVAHGETNLGPWEALMGIFEAVRLSDGERFAAAKCFLPGAAGDMIVARLKAVREEDPDASVRFGLEVGIRYMERKDGTDGYEYVTKSIVKADQADLLAGLRTEAIGYEG